MPKNSSRDKHKNSENLNRLEFPSIEHVCFQQHLGQVKPKRCRCRKRRTLAEATKLVEKGFAQWLVLTLQTIQSDEICPICAGSDLKTTCQNCNRTGKIVKIREIPRLSPTDIVLVTSGCLNDDYIIVYRSVLAKKTPRVATIEKSHIERAYVDGDLEERERIEDYGLLILQARIDMGIKLEPLDNPKTGEGRNCDSGRSPFARISDERTHRGINRVGGRISSGAKHADEE